MCLPKLGINMSARRPVNQRLLRPCVLAMLASLTLSSGMLQAQGRFSRERFSLDRSLEKARSITQTRAFMPDARRLSHFATRQTHLGWASRTPQFEVVAPTKSQAEAAAAEFQRGWNATTRLAKRSGRDTQAVGFAQRSVVLVVDGDQKALPRASREFENQTQYVIQIRSSDSPAAQAHAIRAAASRGLLTASEWNRELPPWFQIGLSEWVASQFDEPSSRSTATTASAESTVVGTSGSFRSARHLTSTTPAEQGTDESLVTFLLEENGGELAWQVLDALSDRGRDRVTHSLQNLRSSVEGSFDRRQLLVHEPKIALAADSDSEPELQALQQDLYVLMRLAERERRLSAGVSTAGRSGQVLVTEFKDGQIQEQTVKSSNKPEMANATNADAAMWKRRLRSQMAGRSWSVLSLDGDWVDHTNALPVARRLESEIEIRFVDNQWMISYPIAGSDERISAVWKSPSSPNSTIQFARQVEAQPVTTTRIVTPNGG